MGGLIDFLEIDDIMSDLKFKEITEKIIGASMKVHAALGNGFKEIIYQRALEIELQESGLEFSRELNIPRLL